jgi:hypothetical protein
VYGVLLYRIASLNPDRRATLLAVLLLAAVCAVSLTVRIRLLDAPLERDEGEHAYMAQTVLAGNPPWKLAYNMKLPGADAIYEISFALFGQTATAIRLALLIVNTATVLLIALLGRRLFGTRAGLAAASCYAVLSFSQKVVGTIAHSTHFVVFFAVIAILLLFRAAASPAWLFLSGLFFGLAFLMKQPAIAFAVFGAVYVVWDAVWRRRRERSPFADGLKGLAAFGSGVVLWRSGVFERFWYWTVTLARAYTAQPGYPLHVLNLNWRLVAQQNLSIWILAALGFFFGCWNRGTRRATIWSGVLLFFSLVAISAGVDYHPHYFILMLLPVALACGAWVASAEEMALKAFGHKAPGGARNLPLLCVAAACLCSVLVQRAYLFSMNSYEFSRTSYGLNPFPEAVVVADYIRQHSDRDARVAVMGSEAEIYFYSRRQAATGYLFTYGLMEEHGYAAADQVEMSNEIEASRPQFIVYVAIPTSWRVRPRSSLAIFDWMDGYTKEHYKPIGMAELRQNAPTLYTWGPAVADYRIQPGAPGYLVLYRRS